MGLVGDVVSGAQNAADDAISGGQNVVGGGADVAGDVAEFERETRDDRWGLYFGEAAKSGSFLDRAGDAADSWLALGYAPGGAAPLHESIAGAIPDLGGNGNDDPSASGLPSWLLPAAVVAAAVGYLVYGGSV